MIETIEVITLMDKVANLPDNAAISSGLAAIYLGIGEKTLLRLRQSGDGPKYFQFQGEGTTARNHKITYEMGDLREWRNKRKVGSTLEAAKVRGMCFSSINDLYNEEPFFELNGKIVSHALDCGMDEFQDLMTSSEVVWQSIIEAMRKRWTSSEKREGFNKPYVEALEQELFQTNSLQENHLLEEVSRK